MDPVAVLFAIDVTAGVLLVLAGLALWRDRQPDDPGYKPRHAARKAPQDGLSRALNDTRRELRRSPAPWAHQGKRHSDKTLPEDPSC